MLALPIALGVGGLQLLHEVGHLLAALRSNVKIGFPVAVPSLQAHRFSHSRSSQPLFSTSAAAPVIEPQPKAARRADTLLTGSHRSSVFTAASPGCSASRPPAVRSSTSLPPGLWWQVPPSPNAATRLLAPVLARAELAARARPRERPAARLTGRPPLATACRRRLLAGVASLAVYLVGLVLSFDLPPLPAEPGALYPVLPTALLQSSLLLGTMAEAILPDLSSSQIVQLHPLAVIGLLASQTCQYTQREFPSATWLVDGTYTHAYAYQGPVPYPMPNTPCAPTRLHGRVAQRSSVAACRAARRRPPRDRGAGTGQPRTGLNRARCRRDSGHRTAQGCRLHAPPPHRRQQPRGPERASPRALSNPAGKLTIHSCRCRRSGDCLGCRLVVAGAPGVCRPSPRHAPPHRHAPRCRHPDARLSAAVDLFGRQPDFALLWPAGHFLPARTGFAHGERVHGVGSDATDRRRLCVPLHAPHVVAVPGRARVPCCTAVSIEWHARTGPIPIALLCAWGGGRTCTYAHSHVSPCCSLAARRLLGALSESISGPWRASTRV